MGLCGLDENLNFREILQGQALFSFSTVAHSFKNHREQRGARRRTPFRDLDLKNLQAEISPFGHEISWKQEFE